MSGDLLRDRFFVFSWRAELELIFIHGLEHLPFRQLITISFVVVFMMILNLGDEWFDEWAAAFTSDFFFLQLFYNMTQPLEALARASSAWSPSPLPISIVPPVVVVPPGGTGLLKRIFFLISQAGFRLFQQTLFRVCE